MRPPWFTCTNPPALAKKYSLSHGKHSRKRFFLISMTVDFYLPWLGPSAPGARKLSWPPCPCHHSSDARPSIKPCGQQPGTGGKGGARERAALVWFGLVWPSGKAENWKRGENAQNKPVAVLDAHWHQPSSKKKHYRAGNTVTPGTAEERSWRSPPPPNRYVRTLHPINSSENTAGQSASPFAKKAAPATR